MRRFAPVLLFSALFVVSRPAWAEIVWRAGFSAGKVELAKRPGGKGWSNGSVPANVTIVADPAQPAGGQAARFSLDRRISPAADGTREVALTHDLDPQSVVEGRERFYAFSLYAPVALPTAVQRIGRFEVAGKTRFAFVVRGEVVDLESYAPQVRGHYGGQASRLAPGRWHRVVLRVLWSRRADRGAVDVWFDGDKMVHEAPVSTLDEQATGPARLVLGLNAAVDPGQAPVVLMIGQAEEATSLADLRKPFQPDVPGQLRTEVEFAHPGGVSLRLDAWTPAGPGPFPAVILVHGGSFTRGDRQSYLRPMMQVLARAGFAWFTVSYRMAPRWKWPAQIEDVEAAVRWVVANANEYRVDRGRLAIFGESAGGFLASAAGVRQAPGGPLAAVMPGYTFHAFELPHPGPDGSIPLPHGGIFIELFGIGDTTPATQARLRAAMPLFNLHPGMPPYLCYHSKDDPAVPFAQSVKMCAAMKAAGLACDVLPGEGFGHGLRKWADSPADHEKLLGWLRQTLRLPPPVDSRKRP